LFAALAAASGMLRTRSIRLAAGAIAGAASLVALAWHYPTCVTGPYGAVDPFVRQAFIDNVVEAAGLFEGTVGDAFAAGGLIAAALIAGCWFAWRRPQRRALLAPSLVMLAFCAMVTVDQIRGAYIGSALAAPVLAGLVLAARSVTRHRALALAGAWLVSAGVVHATLPAYLTGFAKPADAQADESAECYRGDTWQRLDRLPTGVVMAPMNIGARIIGGTRHATIAASYHRNNRGNRASYDFFLSAPDRARKIAAAWNVDYVVLCPDSFGEIGVRKHYPHSLATTLEAGRLPPWLQPIPLPGARLRVYRIVE
jgi:hypothetical protein